MKLLATIFTGKRNLNFSKNVLKPFNKYDFFDKHFLFIPIEIGNKNVYYTNTIFAINFKKYNRFFIIEYPNTKEFINEFTHIPLPLTLLTKKDYNLKNILVYYKNGIFYYHDYDNKLIETLKYEYTKPFITLLKEIFTIDIKSIEVKNDETINIDFNTIEKLCNVITGIIETVKKEIMLSFLGFDKKKEGFYFVKLSGKNIKSIAYISQFYE